jgi:hypothetical protein
MSDVISYISAPAIDNAEPESFASMFRKSAFVQLGDTREKAVAGRIFDVIEDDLYIDFGGKFYCVCPRPSYQSEYVMVSAFVFFYFMFIRQIVKVNPD